MNKNNRLNNVNSQRKNYRLYKAKKQWVTACATFFFTLGASAVVMTTSASAADDPAGIQQEESAAVVASSGSETGESNASSPVAPADQSHHASETITDAVKQTTM